MMFHRSPVRLCKLATLCWALSLHPGTHAGQIDKIRATHEIVIAHRDASIPFSYLDEVSRPIGYTMDLCARIVSALERELKIAPIAVRYLPVTSATRIDAIAQGRAAMECGSTTNTASRREKVDYTIAHFISASRLLVRTDANIDRLEDLEGKLVVSTKGTTNIQTLERVNRERGLRLRVLAAQDHAEGFSMVQNRQAAAFAMDDVLLYGLRASAQQPEAFKVIGKSMSIEPYAIVLPKDDPAFKKLVDAEMRRIIQSGEIKPIYHRWFEQAIPPRGINLSLPMPAMLRDSFRYPSDKVADVE